MDYYELVTTVRAFYTISNLGKKLRGSGITDQRLKDQEHIVHFLRSLNYKVRCPDLSIKDGVVELRWSSPSNTELPEARLSLSFTEDDTVSLDFSTSNGSLLYVDSINRDNSLHYVIPTLTFAFPYVSKKTWKDLKPCPFCGWAMDDEMEVLHPLGYGWTYDTEGNLLYLSHSECYGKNVFRYYTVNCASVSGGCGATIEGLCVDDVVDKWNRRFKKELDTWDDL